MSHSESVEFILKTDENTTFGFTLQGAGLVLSNNNHSSDLQNIVPYPIVGYVEPNSAAEKCSLMQPGDRIVSVNQRSFEGLSVEEARQIIKECGATIRLEIEFDVADTIMLTSGVFQVKLLKKNLDVGITVQCKLCAFFLLLWRFIRLVSFRICMNKYTQLYTIRDISSSSI